VLDSTVEHSSPVVMGDTMIFNSIPILLRSVSADTDTKINTKFQFSILEVST
jgi:hypothetical protein